MAVAPSGELMRLLGWIPARGGSKGVPGKNKRVLGDRPLITHTMVVARAAGCFDRIVVSTDDSEIAQLASEARAEVPWMRPPELASDDSPAMDSLLYDLNRLEEEQNYRPDGVLLLQPTSPFRSVETVRRAAAMLAEAGSESVISVSPAHEHPYWCKRIREDGVLEPFFSDCPETIRRQDLPPAYVLNGVVYAATRDTLVSRHSFHSKNARALLVASEAESLDVDTPFDWLVAETVWRHSHLGVSA